MMEYEAKLLLSFSKRKLKIKIIAGELHAEAAPCNFTYTRWINANAEHFGANARLENHKEHRPYLQVYCITIFLCFTSWGLMFHVTVVIVAISNFYKLHLSEIFYKDLITMNKMV